MYRSLSLELPLLEMITIMSYILIVPSYYPLPPHPQPHFIDKVV